MRTARLIRWASASVPAATWPRGSWGTAAASWPMHWGWPWSTATDTSGEAQSGQPQAAIALRWRMRGKGSLAYGGRQHLFARRAFVLMLEQQSHFGLVPEPTARRSARRAFGGKQRGRGTVHLSRAREVSCVNAMCAVRVCSTPTERHVGHTPSRRASSCEDPEIQAGTV